HEFPLDWRQSPFFSQWSCFAVFSDCDIGIDFTACERVCGILRLYRKPAPRIAGIFCADASTLPSMSNLELETVQPAKDRRSLSIIRIMQTVPILTPTSTSP